jgi:hypothetical protein
MEHLSEFLNSGYVGSLEIGHLAESIPNIELCKSGKGDLLELYSLSAPRDPGIRLKAVSDSRLIKGIDLGGHRNFEYNPLNKEKIKTDLGVIHFHVRCLHHEIENTRKACIGHQWIDEQDSPETSLFKLLNVEPKIANNTDICKTNELDGVSWHKRLWYLKWLKKCISDETYFGSNKGYQNPLFSTQILKVMRIYEDLYI